MKKCIFRKHHYLKKSEKVYFPQNKNYICGCWSKMKSARCDGFQVRNNNFCKKRLLRKICNETENFSSILKVDFGPKLTLQAKECRKIEHLSVRSLKSIYGQILHYKPRNTGKINHAGSILGSNWESMRVP